MYFILLLSRLYDKYLPLVPNQSKRTGYSLRRFEKKINCTKHLFAIDILEINISLNHTEIEQIIY